MENTFSIVRKKDKNGMYFFAYDTGKKIIPIPEKELEKLLTVSNKKGTQ